MVEDFKESLEVRVYELDTQGHLNSAVYHQYAEHVRWKYLRRIGISTEDLLDAGVGPTFLEEKIIYQQELRAGDMVTIGCALVFADDGGKTFRIEQRFSTAEGAPVAQLSAVCGLLDLAQRRLVDNPREVLASLSVDPEALPR